MQQQRDNTWHGAERQQTFLSELPKRLEHVRKRGLRLCAQGFDINLIILLLRETQSLNNACRRMGLKDANESLGSIEQFLAGLVARIELPNSQQTEQAVALFTKLSALIEQYAPHESAEITAPVSVIINPTQPNEHKYPLQTVPPSGYWRRFETTAAAPAPASSPTKARAVSAPVAAMPVVAVVAPALSVAPSPIAAPQPAPPVAAPAAAAARGRDLRRAYHLSDGNAFAEELDQLLKAAGYEVTQLASPQELNEMLSVYAPHTILIDAEFLSALETVGERVKPLRSKLSHRLALVAFSQSAELATRLRAMRAGVDALITQPTSPTDAMARINALFETDADNPFRVLIVEDDRSQAIFAESILRKAGMDARAETDPLMALSRLDDFHPDLILMDLHMPNCDGLELTALIREREAFISTPIVFLSGEHDEDIHFEALNAGGDDFLSKPIQPKHLISAVTNRVRRARQLERRTQTHNPHDPVTGLYDRAYLLDQLTAQLAKEETGKRTGGLVWIDLNDASRTRERVGLVAFEAIVHQLGAFLAHHFGPQDFIARYSDCSFLALSLDKNQAELQNVCATLLQSAARETFSHEGKAAIPELSFGICAFNAGLNEAGAMINAAERALIKARNSGGKAIEVAPSFHSQNPQADDIATQIRAALMDSSFQLLFQPIVALHGTQEEQFQTLLRMRGEGDRLYTAAEIIPVAEREGLIDEIDRWVLSRCLLVITERARQKRPVRLFVTQNIQAARDSQRAPWLKQLLAANRLSGNQLTLDFQCADALSELRNLLTFAMAIKPLGITLALSGFEATPAAYQLLQHLPVQYIRLAPRYTSDALRNQIVRDELQRIVTYAHERGKQVIAPRLEDAQSAVVLSNAGVDYLQGDFVQQAGQELSYDFRASG